MSVYGIYRVAFARDFVRLPLLQVTHVFLYAIALPSHKAVKRQQADRQLHSHLHN